MSVKLLDVLNLAKKLDANLQVKNTENNLDVLIEHAVSDSRRAESGTLFCCIKGEASDGHDYIDAAEAKGAVALLCEREVNSNLPQIIVKSTREVMGEIAALIYDHPAEKLLMIGVTGTNGKTTTT